MNVDRYAKVKNKVGLEKLGTTQDRLANRYQHRYSQGSRDALIDILALCDISNICLPLWANLAIVEMCDAKEE